MNASIFCFLGIIAACIGSYYGYKKKYKNCLCFLSIYLIILGFTITAQFNRSYINTTELKVYNLEGVRFVIYPDKSIVKIDLSGDRVLFEVLNPYSLGIIFPDITVKLTEIKGDL